MDGCDGDNSLSEYELKRLKNIEENKMMMIELGLIKPKDENSPPIHRTRTKSGSRLSLPQSCNTRRSKSLRNKDLTPVSSVKRRRSNRIAGKLPTEVQFTNDVARIILGDQNSCQVFYTVDEDADDDCDKVSCSVKRKKFHQVHHNRSITVPRDIPSVDDITEEDLQRVAEFVRAKVYSQDGTTCHQCRQKTLDQKTYCRSKECFGIRGQFCGPCLKNRYGELVVQALKNPEWSCPPCRGLCNCSICRTQQGKVPTGQIFFMAKERGYKSVLEFLEKEAEVEDIS